MKKNVGQVDKMVRLAVVAVILGLFFTEIISGTLAIVLLVFCTVFLISTLIGFCPLYTLFGINTCSTEKK